jgi:predicted nucleic acid-binding protein
MIVVADASPLNYLVLIEQIGLLPTLYGSVLIPEAVHRELQRPGTPAPATRCGTVS